MTTLAMSTQRVIGLVLVSVFGTIILFVVLAALVLWLRHRRAYAEPRPPRPPRIRRRRRRRNTDTRLNDVVLANQDTDRFNPNTWESSP